VAANSLGDRAQRRRGRLGVASVRGNSYEHHDREHDDREGHRDGKPDNEDEDEDREVLEDDAAMRSDATKFGGSIGVDGPRAARGEPTDLIVSEGIDGGTGSGEEEDLEVARAPRVIRKESDADETRRNLGLSPRPRP